MVENVKPILQKGDILCAKDTNRHRHYIVFLDKIDDISFKACILSHDSKNGNVKMEENHFFVEDDSAKKYQFQYDDTHLIVNNSFIKMSNWVHPEIVGKLTDIGVEFIEANISQNLTYWSYPIFKMGDPETIRRNEQSIRSQRSRKNLLTYLFIALFAVSAVSCKKDKDENGNGKVQLVKTITVSSYIHHQDNYCYDFEYDNKNSITCVRGKFEWGGNSYNADTLIYIRYSGDDLIKVEHYTNNGYYYFDTFIREGNKIILEGGNTTIELNSDGYPIKTSNNFYTEILQYLDGNLVSIGWINSDFDRQSYKYDNKKSPFYYSKTPKWFHICYNIMFEGCDLGLFRSIKNNLIEDIYRERDEGVLYEYISEWVYEYDANGFPTKGYRKNNNNDVVNYTFTYY